MKLFGKRVKKVGISGSFGRGNLGDELFIEAHKKYFEGRAKLFMMTNLSQTYYLRKFSENFIDEMDAIAIGGGDLICPYREKLDMDFSNPLYLRKPVHMVGIGVENNKPIELDSTMEKWKRFLGDDNLKSITVRDTASQKWLEEKIFAGQNIPYHPDIVLSLPFYKSEHVSRRPILGIVTRSITHPRQMEKLKDAASYLQAQGWRIRHIIFGVGRHGKEEHEASKHLVIDGKETLFSNSMDNILTSISDCSLVFSMKLHATVVATMYDVPTVVLSSSGKLIQFMQAIGREKFIMSPDSAKLLETVKDGVPEVDTQRVNQLRQKSVLAMESFVERVAS